MIALQAARSGQGVVLGWASLVRPLIKAGDLVQVTDAEIVAPHSYFVTWSARRPLSRQASILGTGCSPSTIEFNSTEAGRLFA